jgi:hypothetical protein
MAVLAVVDGVAHLMRQDADGTRTVTNLGTDEDFVDTSLACLARPALANPFVDATATWPGAGNPNSRDRKTDLGEAGLQLVGRVS